MTPERQRRESRKRSGAHGSVRRGARSWRWGEEEQSPPGPGPGDRPADASVSGDDAGPDTLEHPHGSALRGLES